MKTRSHKIINKSSKKLDEDKILEKIEKEIIFQNKQAKIEMFNHKLSKNQRKKLYESMIYSMNKVIKLREKIGLKQRETGRYLYFKMMLKSVNEEIKRSQTVGKRIVLTEKNNKKQK